MRKMFLIVLSLVIVSMFIVGCGTGQAVRAKNVEKQVPSNPKAQLCSNGWGKYCGYLLEGETRTYTLDNAPYEIKVDSILYQDYPGGVHQAALTVNGKAVYILEGEEKQLSDGRFMTLPLILYQDYAGGVHQVELCLR